jgi:molecular chaperone GrpE
VTDDQKEDVEAKTEEPQEIDLEQVETKAVEAEISTAEEPEEPLDELETLRLALEEAKAQEAEYLDGWQRARAELANARKRFQRDREQAYGNAKADILVRLLPIVDDFERAFATLPDDLAGQTWLEGIRLIQQKFTKLLEQEGVTPIEAEGEAFDPFVHEAVTHEPSQAVPEGHIIAEVQRGYKVGDRVLRPCAVRVSSGPLAEPENAEEEEGALEEA